MDKVRCIVQSALMIKALGYLAFRTDRIAEWGDYARGLLGLQLIDRGPGQLAFRMDDRCQRLMVVEEPGQPLACMGWEVADAAAMEAVAARLSNSGHAIWAPWLCAHLSSASSTPAFIRQKPRPKARTSWTLPALASSSVV